MDLRKTRTIFAVLCVVAACFGTLISSSLASAHVNSVDSIHPNASAIFANGNIITIHNLYPDYKTYCLGIANASVISAAGTIIWTCNNNKDQQWLIQSGHIVNNRFYFQLKNINSNQCLGLFGGTTEEGVTPIQWPCNNDLDQEWTYISSGITFHLQNENSNDCLGVYDGNVYQGATPVQWGCNSNPDQFWD